MAVLVSFYRASASVLTIGNDNTNFRTMYFDLNFTRSKFGSHTRHRDFTAFNTTDAMKNRHKAAGTDRSETLVQNPLEVSCLI